VVGRVLLIFRLMMRESLFLVEPGIILYGSGLVVVFYFVLLIIRYIRG
jgi:hypothetical protein